MCRNITELRGLEPAATREEMEAAAGQYIRKVTGIAEPNPALAEEHGGGDPRGAPTSPSGCSPRSPAGSADRRRTFRRCAVPK